MRRGERQRHRFATREDGARAIHGIARVGHQHAVPGIDHGERRVTERLLRSNNRQDLRRRIQLHAEASVEPPRDLFAKDGETIARRILVMAGVVRGGRQCVDDRRRGWHVRIADAQVDDVLAAGDCLALETVDLDEEVRRQHIEPVGAGKRSHGWASLVGAAHAVNEREVARYSARS